MRPFFFALYELYIRLMEIETVLKFFEEYFRHLFQFPSDGFQLQLLIAACDAENWNGASKEMITWN